MKRLIALTLLIVTLVSSCSVLRVALRYADWMIVREANKVFDLDSSQKSKLKIVVDTELSWIKKNWVPELIALARQIDKKAIDGLDESDHIWLDKEWVKLRTRLAEHVVPSLAPIAVTINSEQLVHAKKEFKDRNKKWTDQAALSDQKLVAKRRSKVVENIEDWYGNLSDKQEEQLCEIFRCDRKELERLMASTNAFQDALIDLIANERDPKKWSAKAILWAAEPQSVLVEPHKSEWLAFRKEQPKRFAALDAMMTEKQRLHAREKLKSTIDDLEWFAGN